VRLRDIGRCLHQQELYRLLDPVETEADHLLLGVAVSIPHCQLLHGDWLLSALVVGDRGRRKDCVDAVDGRSLDEGYVRPIIGLGGGVAEIVDIDLEEPGG